MANNVTEAECNEMRQRFDAMDVPTYAAVAEQVDYSARTVQRHVDGNCSHAGERNPASNSTVSAGECRKLREAYRELGSDRAVGEEFGRPRTTVGHHLRAVCSHDCETNLAAELSPHASERRTEIIPAQCLAFRRARERGETIQAIAEGCEGHERTVQKHISGRCEHHDLPDPLMADGIAAIQEYVDEHGECYAKARDLAAEVDINKHLVPKLLDRSDQLEAEKWGGQSSPWHIQPVATDGAGGEE